ncbi:type 2 periplasmic-binding domain-containing protein [Streptomyces avermitilis]|uniref:hypothetical protein n=1 Tax=Streptomyces avermitilis TaxID=33903 RepID=UPI0036BAC5AE
MVALSVTHPAAGQEVVRRSDLRHDEISLWPRDAAPRYYDTILDWCRAGGLEPPCDATSSTATPTSALSPQRRPSPSPPPRKHDCCRRE